MNYKYNEKTYAELIYKKGFQSKHIPTELRLLVLYFRDILNLKPREREFKIYKFCQKYIPDFKKENFYKSINKALRAGFKKEQKLVEILKIDIHKSEIDYINSLELNQEYKKVMFTFLVQLKLNKIVYEYKYNKEYNNNFYFRGGLKKYSNIKKISNIPQKISLNDDIINELAKLKLVTILHRGMIYLDYVENCISEGEVKIVVTDFENIGLYLDFYNGDKKIIKCEECGKLIKHYNTRKYCDECAEEKERVRKRQWKRNFSSENENR